MLKNVFLSAVFAAGLLASGAASGQTLTSYYYTIQDLGRAAPGICTSLVCQEKAGPAINELGQVALSLRNSAGVGHAARGYTSATDLDPSRPAVASRGIDISDSGRVVGDDGNNARPIFTDGGGTLSPVATWSPATLYGISPGEEVMGGAFEGIVNGAQVRHAFWASQGAVSQSLARYIPGPYWSAWQSPYSVVYDVADGPYAPHFAGQYENASGQRRGFVLDYQEAYHGRPAGFIEIPPFAVGLESTAFGVNSNGLVVGCAQDAQANWLAYRFHRASGTESIATTPPTPLCLYDVNNYGAAVGGGDSVSVLMPAWAASTAFIINSYAYAQPRDLNERFNRTNQLPSGREEWWLIRASGINEQGQIAGIAAAWDESTNQSELRVVRLNPVTVPVGLTLDEHVLVYGNAVYGWLDLSAPVAAGQELAVDWQRPADVEVTMLDAASQATAHVPTGETRVRVRVQFGPMASQPTGPISTEIRLDFAGVVVSSPLMIAPPESCGNGLDDDLDGNVDCTDLECDREACDTGVCVAQACIVPPPETCDDGVDNDFDTLADCLDLECEGRVCADGRACVAGSCDVAEVSCADGFDGDYDGATDCADADCAGKTCAVSGICSGFQCDAPESNCWNGIDDDGDGNDDCADADCLGLLCAPSNGSCILNECLDDEEPNEICNDGEDNDGDDLNDCEDDDCNGLLCDTDQVCSNFECVEARELDCSDLQDNDFDEAADCHDSDCDGAVCHGGGVCAEERCLL